MKKSLSNDQVQMLLESAVEGLVDATNNEHCFVLMSLPADGSDDHGHLVANMRDESLRDAIEILRQELKVTYQKHTGELTEPRGEH